MIHEHCNGHKGNLPAGFVQACHCTPVHFLIVKSLLHQRRVHQAFQQNLELVNQKGFEGLKLGITHPHGCLRMHMLQLSAWR